MLEIISRFHLVQLQQCAPTPCSIDLRATSVVIRLFYMSHPLLSYRKCFVIFSTIHSPRKEAHQCSPLTSILVLIHVPSSNTSSLPDHSLNSESSYLLSDSLKLKATMSMYYPGLVKSTRQYHSINTESSYLLSDSLKYESNHEHELSWARKIHMTIPFYIHTSSSSLTHEEVPPRILAL